MPLTSPLTSFDPLVREWFQTSFATVTEPQRQGWQEIRAGRDVLISAPTGAGKTLAAFLSAIDDLVRRAREGELPNQTQVLYVSPLKALSNDIHKNLEIPLAGIAALARAKGVEIGEIRAAVRTGDTPASERARMGKHAPHILVTTPESLYILLTAEKPRQMLSSVRTLIIDEIHAVADDKRGSHLALSIARLEALVEAPLQKIGLSATVSPIEEVAQFLSPQARIVQVGHRRALDLGVEVPRDELGAVASTEMWDEIYATGWPNSRGSTGPRWFSSIPGDCRSAWRITWENGWRAMRCCHITGVSRGGCVSRQNRSSRRANCGWWWRQRRWNWGSISERWIWCARSVRRARSAWGSSVWAVRDIGSALCRKDGSSQPRATN